MDFQQLLKEHPVAVVGAAGGLALAGITFLSKRGQTAATYPSAPISPGGSGSGFLPTFPYPPIVPPNLPAPAGPNPPLPVPGGTDPNPNPNFPTPVNPIKYGPQGPFECAPGYHYDPILLRCVQDEIPRGPDISAPGISGAGSGDYSYMAALDKAKQSMSMRLGVPWT
jgi:hypothetical protein